MAKKPAKRAAKPAAKKPVQVEPQAPMDVSDEERQLRKHNFGF